MKKLSPTRSKLLSNTIFLYILSFSNQFLGLVTVPYLTRILGPSVYGKLGVAMSLMVYVQIILDFGFILSATERISKNRNNDILCSEIFSAVSIVKIMLAIITGVLFFIICNVVQAWKKDIWLYCFFYIAYCINSFLPDFLYRGKEEMQVITIRTVCVRVFFTLLIFVFVKDEHDLIKYPIILGIGNLISVIWSVVHVHHKYNIRFVKTGINLIKDTFKVTLPFFASRIAATFYQAATTIILGTMYANQPVVGYYSSADKLMSATKSVSSPVADSLYPYMTKNKDYKVIKRILLVACPIIVIIGIVTFIYAKEICIILFGKEYGEAANVLRCMIPAMAVIFPTYIVCFPVLTPMGLSKYANLSNILGACVQIASIVILLIFNSLNVYTLCICGSTSEVIVFLFRIGVAFKYRYKIKTV